MKVFGVVMIVMVAVAMIFVAGCTSEQKSEIPNPDAALIAKVNAEKAAAAAAIAAEAAKPKIGIESYEGKWTKYGGYEVTGIIYNNGPTDKAVFGYVDFYNADGVKEDSAIFSAKPDAFGKATFKTTGRDISTGGTYSVRITNIYNN